jgi:hypothetical protein
MTTAQTRPLSLFVVFIIKEDDEFAPAKAIVNFRYPAELHRHKSSVNKKLGLGQMLAEK